MILAAAPIGPGIEDMWDMTLFTTITLLQPRLWLGEARNNILRAITMPLR